MATAEAAARSLAWEELHPRSPTSPSRSVSSFLASPSKPVMRSPYMTILDANAKCDHDRRRLQRTRMLTQGQRPQSASADQRRERQRARERHRAITQPEDRDSEELRRHKEARLLVRHTGLEPQTSRHQTRLLLTGLSLALDRRSGARCLRRLRQSLRRPTGERRRSGARHCRPGRKPLTLALTLTPTPTLTLTLQGREENPNPNPNPNPNLNPNPNPNPNANPNPNQAREEARRHLLTQVLKP